MIEHERNYDRRVEAAMATPSRGAALGSSLADDTAKRAYLAKREAEGGKALEDLTLQIDTLRDEIERHVDRLTPVCSPWLPSPATPQSECTSSSGHLVDTIRSLTDRVAAMRTALADAQNRLQF